MKLSKTFHHRNVWLGCAMILIALYHSGFHIPHNLFLFIKQIGYGGVDICLFASGIGCYYSLEKDAHLLNFLKRRAARLYPTYLCFIIPWMVYKFYTGNFPVISVIGNLLGIESLISWGYHFNWYISCLVVFYILAPYFKQITDTCKHLRGDVLVLLLLIVSSIPFWNHGRYIIMVIRLPLFYLGMVYAKYAVRGTVITLRIWMMHLMSVVVGLIVLHYFLLNFDSMLWSHGLYWYPFILIVPGVCLLFSQLAALAQAHAVTRWICRLLSTIGIYSFEVYLIHDFLYETIMPTVTMPDNWIRRNLLWLCTIPIIIIGSVLLNRMAKWIPALLFRHRSPAAH